MGMLQKVSPHQTNLYAGLQLIHVVADGVDINELSKGIAKRIIWH